MARRKTGLRQSKHKRYRTKRRTKRAKRRTKRTKRAGTRIRYKQRGGFLMGDFVNLGRNILYNTQNVWSGFRAEPSPVNPNPTKGQFKNDLI
jgi:hypothetical protein